MLIDKKHNEKRGEYDPSQVIAKFQKLNCVVSGQVQAAPYALDDLPILCS